jgi:hypothetical protein
MNRKTRIFGEVKPFLELEQELDQLLEIKNKYSDETRFLREGWKESLTDVGWVPEFRLGDSNLRLGYKRDRSGLCIQLGNVCRFHSDLLKLSYLGQRKSIDHAVIVVPSDAYSKELGSNHASYSKCERDLELFIDVLGMPILLMEVDGGPN